MSIDTLKLIDGGFRRANYSIIKKMLLAGHTEHLQAAGGTVAIRPYVGERTVNQFVADADRVRKLVEVQVPDKRVTIDRDTRAPGCTTEGESQDFSLRNDMTAAIRYVFEYLNGSLDTWYEAGDGIGVWSNQAEREGCILATIGDQAILEYEMPGTTSQYGYNRRTGQYRHEAQPTSALRIITTIGRDEITHKACSYNTVPKRWIAAIRAAGMDDWIGMGQRSTTRIPFPAE